jgi:uncharacterized protein (DUF58 family)
MMIEHDDDAYLDYRVRWRAGDPRPGRHAARQSGAGGDFRAHRPFWQLPDARRIDVRRSICDPFGELVVRQMENRGSIVVMLAVDLSCSMRNNPGAEKFVAVARLARAASRSALRAGDAFGFVGFDEAPREAFCAAPSRSRGAAAQMVERLAELEPSGISAAGITQVAGMLPERRCLVLLASDFLMPLQQLEAALQSLARHDVAPVILQDPGEESPPRLGLLRLQDAETGRTRLLLMRPALRRKWRDARAARQAALEAMFSRFARPAFSVRGRLDVAALGEHLLAG